MTNLKELRALCDAATDGNWDCMNDTLDTPYVTSMFAGLNDICDLYHKSPDGKVHTKDNAKANARFIAATDPTTVRALIDEIEKLRGALREAINDLDQNYMEINPNNYDHDDVHRINNAMIFTDHVSYNLKQALKGQDDGSV